MKKIFYSAIAIMAIVSCSKELSAPVLMEAGELTLEAQLENVTSKTSLQEDGSVKWANGDQISVLWNGGSAVSNTLSLTEDSANASFSVVAESTPVYAVYPAGVAASYNGSVLNVTIPARQDGSFASSAIEVGKIASGSIAFKNVGSLLKLTLGSDAAAVKKIVIAGWGSHAVAGTVSLEEVEGVPTVKAMAADSSRTVTVTANGAGTYYAAVAPGALRDGIYVALYDASDALVGEKLSGKAVSLARKTIIDLGTIEVKMLKKLYLEPNGTGDGSGWGAAAAPLKAFSTDNLASYDCIFYAGKEYFYNGEKTSGKTGVVTNVYVLGGFEAKSGADLTIRDTKKYVTVIDGRENAEGTEPFGTKGFFNGPKKTGGLTVRFDGITFQNWLTTGTAGAVMQVEASACYLYINNCRFTKNFASANSGSAIRATSGTIYVSNSIFENNTADVKGVAVASNGKIVSNNNIFRGNKSTDGGVFYATSSSSTVTITSDNDLFENNTAADKGGFIYCTNAKPQNITVTKAIIRNNSATEGKLVWSDATGAVTLKFIGCTISGNTGSDDVLSATTTVTYE